MRMISINVRPHDRTDGGLRNVLAQSYLTAKSIKIKINLRADWNTNEESEFAAITREIEIGVICCDNVYVVILAISFCKWTITSNALHFRHCYEISL